jgi:hypothetical protein
LQEISEAKEVIGNWLKKEERFLRDISTKTILFIVTNFADYAKVDIEFLEKVKAGSSVAMSND